jgi:hypothetical protein
VKPFACTAASAPLNPSPPGCGFVNAGAGAVRAGLDVGAEAPPLVVVCAGAVLDGVVAVLVVRFAGCVLLVLVVCVVAGELAAVTVLVPPPHPLSSGGSSSNNNNPPSAAGGVADGVRGLIIALMVFVPYAVSPRRVPHGRVAGTAVV